MRPGPKSAAAAPCSQTAAQAASNAGMPLREQPRDEAAEHVAGAGGREPGRRVVVDGGAAVGRGDDGVGALEHDDGADLARRGAGAVELAALA